MSASGSLRIWGADHAATGRVTLHPAMDRAASPAALCISAGLKKGFNEDAAGWERYDRRAFYAVADAHFGGRSAIVAVDCSLSMLSARILRKDHFEPDRFRRVFAESLTEIERRLSTDSAAGESETTLLAVAIGWDRIYYGSVGDSRLYSVNGSARRQVNRISNEFLGSAPRPQTTLSNLMVCGEVRGLTGRGGQGRLMLATDGVPLSRGAQLEDWTPESIGTVLLEAPDVSAAAVNIAAAALRRGGEDNICAIVIDPKPPSAPGGTGAASD